jgi:hypothetical protein
MRTGDLKEEGFMGFTTLKSSAARAPQEIDGGTDLYEMTAVAADRPLKDSGKLTFLKVKLDGVDSKHPVLNSGRQRMQEGVLEIQKEGIPPSPPYTLGEHDFPSEWKEFLEPEFHRAQTRAQEAAHAAETTATPSPWQKTLHCFSERGEKTGSLHSECRGSAPDQGRGLQ